MQSMTPKPDKAAIAAWLRRLDRASSGFERSRAVLEDLIADARAAKVPLTSIADHTPYSREWARQIADRVDAARALASQGAVAAPAKPAPGPQLSELVRRIALLKADRVAELRTELRNAHTAWFAAARKATAELKGDERTWTIIAMAAEAGYLTDRDIAG